MYTPIGLNYNKAVYTTVMFIDATVAKTMRVLATTIVFGVSLFVLYRLRSVVSWLAIGTFLAIIINPAVSKVSRHMPKKKRGYGVAIVFVCGIILLSLLIAVFITPVVKQASALVQNWPETTAQISNNIQHSDQAPYKFIREHDLVGYFQDNEDQIKDSLNSFFGASFEKVLSIFGSIGAMFTIAAMTVYMSIHGPRYALATKKLLPKRHHKDIELLSGKMYAAVTGYVNGNLLTSGIAGVAGGVASAVLGLPYPALLGLIVGLTDLIPMIGATLGAAIVVIIALFSSVSAAVIMAIFFIVYQQLENYVLVPRIMGRTVEMSSFAVFVAALSGGILAGFIGALVAIPIGACIQILINYALQKQLAKRRDPVQVA